MRLLDVIERTGSLGNAARALGISQPAATLLLQEVEESFGTTLAIRTALGCRLNAAGTRALARLRVAMMSIDRAIEAAQSHDAEPILRIGAMQLAGVELLPRALARSMREGTLGRYRLVEGRSAALIQDLCNGELDCVIGWLDEAMSHTLPLDQLMVRPLTRSRMRVVASARHPLARQRAVSVAELARQPWLVARPNTRVHDAFVRLFLAQGLPSPVPAMECAAIHTALHIVSSTRMLAVVPDVIAAGYERSGQLAPLRGPELELDPAPVYLITHHSSDALPIVAHFREALAAPLKSRTGRRTG